MHVPDAKADLEATYSAAFFEQHRAALPAYRELARLIRQFVAEPANSSIVDVGCGHGLLVECLRAEGFVRAYGVEGSRSAETMWPTQNRAYYRITDLTNEYSISVMPATELVCSFETAEHLPAEASELYVGILTAHRPSLVLFSAATTFQDQGQNPTHVNEQPFGYWVNRFQSVGYVLDIPNTVNSRNAMFGQFSVFNSVWWYPKNFLVFRRGDVSVENPHGLRLVDDQVVGAPIRWFSPLQNQPVMNLLFERDKFEYLYLIENYLRTKRVPTPPTG